MNNYNRAVERERDRAERLLVQERDIRQRYQGRLEALVDECEIMSDEIMYIRGCRDVKNDGPGTSWAELVALEYRMDDAIREARGLPRDASPAADTSDDETPLRHCRNCGVRFVGPADEVFCCLRCAEAFHGGSHDVVTRD